MNKSFSVLKTNIGTLVQDTSSGLATSIGVWINNRYRDILTKYEWEELIVNMSLTASASTSAYKCDEDIERILFFLDATNDGYLSEVGEQQFYQGQYSVFSTTGTPERYFLKYDVVRSQPASAEKLTTKSSSASDTTQSLFIRGISSSTEVYETLNLSGTTVVSAANSYTRIIGLAKSASTVGNVTVYENDVVTVLSLFSPEQLESRYRQLHVHPIPTGAIVYHIKALRRILPLSQTLDYPALDVSDTIELGAIADAWRYKRQFQKAKEYEFMYEKSLTEKIFQRQNRPNLIHQFIPTPLNRNDGIL